MDTSNYLHFTTGSIYLGVVSTRLRFMRRGCSSGTFFLTMEYERSECGLLQWASLILRRYLLRRSHIQVFGGRVSGRSSFSISCYKHLRGANFICSLETNTKIWSKLTPVFQIWLISENNYFNFLRLINYSIRLDFFVYSFYLKKYLLITLQIIYRANCLN